MTTRLEILIKTNVCYTYLMVGYALTSSETTVKKSVLIHRDKLLLIISYSIYVY